MNKKIEKKFSIFLSNLSTLNKFKSSLFPFKYNSLRIISPKIPNNIPFAPYPRSNHSLSLLESFLIKPKILFFCCFFIIYISGIKLISSPQIISLSSGVVVVTHKFLSVLYSSSISFRAFNPNL